MSGLPHARTRLQLYRYAASDAAHTGSGEGMLGRVSEIVRIRTLGAVGMVGWWRREVLWHAGHVAMPALVSCLSRRYSPMWVKG